MNYLLIAQSFTGLFPSKIAVTLVEAISDKVISTYTVNKKDLPVSFEKPTIIESWRVIKATPLRKKKITLYVVSSANESYFSNLVPTKALLPDVIAGDLSTEHLVIAPHSWRQLEFLPSSMLPSVTEEFSSIEGIISEGGLLGYNTCHIRQVLPSYKLPVKDLLDITKGMISGSVYINGIINHSFHLKSEDNTYYGAVQDGYITLLCLENFDGVNEELMEVLTKYDLMLVDWCHPQIIH